MDLRRFEVEIDEKLQYFEFQSTVRGLRLVQVYSKFVGKLVVNCDLFDKSSQFVFYSVARNIYL